MPRAVMCERVPAPARVARAAQGPREAERARFREPAGTRGRSCASSSRTRAQRWSAGRTYERRLPRFRAARSSKNCRTRSLLGRDWRTRQRWVPSRFGGHHGFGQAAQISSLSRGVSATSSRPNWIPQDGHSSCDGSSSSAHGIPPVRANRRRGSRVAPGANLLTPREVCRPYATRCFALRELP